VLRECDAIFNPANKFCYDGEVYDKCNGKEYANPADKFCYSGTVYDKCGGKEYANPANKFCYNGTAYDKCDGQEYANPADKFCYSGTVYDKCGGKEYANPVDKFCYDGVAYGKCDGMEYNPSSQICTDGVANTARCNGEGYNPLTRYCHNDSKFYKIVVIGEQMWMAENLNDNVAGSKCYGEDGQVFETNTAIYTTLSNAEVQANCEKYGRLYNWATAITVCPSGWHLPSNADWNILMRFVNPSCSDNSSCAGAGTKLKAAEGWNDYKSSGNGTDDYGFSALPGGDGGSNGLFGGVGDRGGWWSATKSSAYSAYSRNMDYYEDVGYYDSEGSQFSVRCLRD
jgi:uncharacterized protein (TIGR02145 family)